MAPFQLETLALLLALAYLFPAEATEALERLMLALATEYANLRLYIFARVTYWKMRRTFNASPLPGFELPPFRFVRIQDRKR
jgi:hypothetical protein